MFDFDAEKERFEDQCTACGLCVTVCPIVPLTDIEDEEPDEVMESILDLYRHGTLDDKAKSRIYSCMGCLLCRSECPEGLDPSLGLFLARSILHDRGEPLPGACPLAPDGTRGLRPRLPAVEPSALAHGPARC